MLVRLLNNPLIKTQDNNAETVPDISEIVKSGEIREFSGSAPGEIKA